MKYALVYDVGGSDAIYGNTECLDLKQLAQLCETLFMTESTFFISS